MVFPDFRIFLESAIPSPHTYKKNILHPKPPRDFLINLYFSKPDYADPHKKVFYSTFLGAKAGAFYATYEVLALKMRLEHRALEVAAKRFFFIVSGVVAYGAVTTAVANLRGQKDGYLNHAIGGASVGFIYGYAKRSSGLGCGAAALSAFIALALKHAYVENIPVVPKYFMQGLNLTWGSEEYDDWRLVKHRNVNAYPDVPRTERYV